MPFGVQRGWQRYALPHPEILSYPLETNVIDSVVLNSSGVAPDGSGPYMNRRYLVAGTILSKRSDNTYEQYTGAIDTDAGQQFTVSFVGPPTGGTFALGIEGDTTGQQDYVGLDATLLQGYLDGLPQIGAGKATVSGPVADAQGDEVYTVTLATTLSEIPIPQADSSQLTGPGNQDIVVVETQQAGVTGTQNVAGILYDTVEFADGSELSDEPVAMLRRNVSFKASAIIGFATYEAAVVAALSTCEFV
jgi:hypothetical protein